MSIDALANTADSGRRVGSYRLVAVLGSGGMGTVWRARDEVLERDVAFKVLSAERVRDPDARARMLREARAQAALTHPNVCTIYAAGDDGHDVWIAMERLPGPTLATRAKAGAIEPAVVAKWGLQMARALVAAHGKGLVHRDLKPSNAMLDGEGNVKLLDFGLAKVIAPASGEASTGEQLVETTAGVVLGTPRYMSPEQAAGKPLGMPTDVFSLGVMLYELLAGKSPFAGSTPTEVMAAIIHFDPAQLEPLSGVPSELDAIVRACLQHAAADRITSAKLVDQLDAMPQGAATAQPRSRSRRPMLALAVAVGIVGLVMAALALGRHEPTTAPADGRSAMVTQTDAVVAPVEQTIHADHSLANATFDRSGRWLFTITDDGRLWRTGEGAPVEVHGLAKLVDGPYGLDGNSVVVRTIDGFVGVDPETLSSHPISSLDPNMGAVAISGGAIAAEAGDGVVFGMRDGDAIGGLRPYISDPNALFPALRWSSDGALLAFIRSSATGGRTLEVVPLVTRPSPPLTAHVVHSLVTSSSYRVDGFVWIGPRRLAIADEDGTGTVIVVIEVDDSGVALRETKVGTYLNRAVQLVAASATKLAVVDVTQSSGVTLLERQGKQYVESRLTDDAIASVAGWTTDGRIVMNRQRADGRIEIVTQAIGGHANVLDPASQTEVAATISDDHILFRSETATWELAPEGHRQQLWDDGPHAARSRIKCAARSSHCAVFDAATDAVIQFDLASKRRGRPLIRDHVPFALSADGTLVAVARRAAIEIVRWIDGAHVATLAAPRALVGQFDGVLTSVAFWGEDVYATKLTGAVTSSLIRLGSDGRVDTVRGGDDLLDSVTVDPTRERLAVTRKHYRLVTQLWSTPPAWLAY